MLLSQFIPPTPFLTGSTGLFCMSASPLLPANRFVSNIFLDSIYMCSYIFAFFLLIYFTLYMGSRSIYLIRTDSNAFLFVAE